MQISINAMHVFEASLTLSFLQQYKMLVVPSRRLWSGVSSAIRFLFQMWLASG